PARVALRAGCRALGLTGSTAQSSLGVRRRSARADAVADADISVAQDVRPESGSVDERSEQPGPSELLQVRARLGEPASDAFDGPDGEAPADEAVQRDPARDDVPACLFPREADLVEHLGLHERQLVAAAGPAEGAPAVEVAVAL